MALVIYEHLIEVHFPYDFIIIQYEDQDDYSTFPNSNNVMAELNRTGIQSRIIVTHLPVVGV